LTQVIDYQLITVNRNLKLSPMIVLSAKPKSGNINGNYSLQNISIKNAEKTVSAFIYFAV